MEGQAKSRRAGTRPGTSGARDLASCGSAAKCQAARRARDSWHFPPEAACEARLGKSNARIAPVPDHSSRIMALDPEPQRGSQFMRRSM